MIITDSHYIIGKSHLTCDDYAVHGDKCGHSYIMVSDGCSSSPRSELGARYYSLAFESLLSSLRDHFDYLEFGNNLVNRAKTYSICLESGQSCLDATVVGAITLEDMVHIFMYGDGLIFYKFKMLDDIFYTSVSFEKEVPYYLSYRIDNDRNISYESYAKEYDECPMIISDGILSGTTIKTNHRYDNEVCMNLDKKYLEFVGVSSDGLSSFVKKYDNGSIEKVNLIDVLKRVTEFNSINKSYVKRTLKRLRDMYSKENTDNMDDISLAVMYFKD